MTPRLPRLTGETFRHFFVLCEEGFGHVGLERFEEFLLAGELCFPLVRFHGNQFISLLLGNSLESFEIEVLGTGNVTNRSFSSAVLPSAAVANPLEHPHVVAKTGPEKFSIGTFAEPVYVENERRIRQSWTDL